MSEGKTRKLEFVERIEVLFHVLKKYSNFEEWECTECGQSILICCNADEKSEIANMLYCTAESMMENSEHD